MQFKKAERKQARLRLGIAGTSGSGKTWSALEIATGMGGKIAMIDAESGRGELYAADFDYDVTQLEEFSPDSYIKGIKSAEQLGYDILIIDGLSQAWMGEGGVLSIVDKAGGNSFTNGWRVATPKQNALVNAIITSKLHIIFTMRSKAEYIIEEVRGKSVPKKVGMAPIQREGLEYECTLYIEMSQDHTGFVSKDNTKLYDQQYVTPSKKMGTDLIEWLNSGKSHEQITAESFDKDKSLILDSINATGSLDELKDKYTELLHKYKSDSTLINELIASKEQRKKELSGVSQ